MVTIYYIILLCGVSLIAGCSSPHDTTNVKPPQHVAIKNDEVKTLPSTPTKPTEPTLEELPTDLTVALPESSFMPTTLYPYPAVPILGSGGRSDQCPADPFKRNRGICGCGIPDTDSDNDGTPDCLDNCPRRAGPQIDTDSDGQPDGCDCAPQDPTIGGFSGRIRYVSVTGSDDNNDCLAGTNPCGNISHAIDVAASGDAIFLDEGTFNEHSLLVAKNLLFFGVDPALSIVNGQQIDRVFSVNPQIAATFCHLTISGGSVPAGTGGGIFSQGNATVFNARIWTNTAQQAGGFGADPGTTTKIVNSSFNNNIATAFAGAVGNGGTMTITNSTLNANDAPNGAGAIGNFGTLTVTGSFITSNTSLLGGGGAIGNGGTLIISKTTLDSNQAQGGGAIGNGGSVTISDSIVSNNSSVSFGGAISSGDNLIIERSSLINNTVVGSGGAINSDGNVTLIDTIISNNTATLNGGGIRQANVNQIAPTITFQNTTVANNTAGIDGGGMALYPQALSPNTAILTNSTFSGNSATGNGGGIYADQTTFLTLNNSTVVQNTVSGLGNELYKLSTAVLTSYHSIVGTGTNSCAADAGLIFANANYSLFSDTTCTVAVGTNNVVNVSPNLGLLQNNGGITPTHALLTGSPAIDAGDLACGVTTDQRGQPRPVDIPGVAPIDLAARCDIGSFELQP